MPLNEQSALPGSPPSNPPPQPGASPPSGPPPGAGFWQSVKSRLIQQLSGITIIGVLGTLIVGYFQNQSAYENKVAALAKDDMTAATQTFAEASIALSSAMSLQQRLTNYFYAAVPNDVFKNEDAYPTAGARAMYKDYVDTYTSLHQNYNLLARKAEIYLDWPSDPSHDAATNTAPNVDPINISTLGEFDFDCEKYMPNFAPGNARVPL